MIDLAIGQRFQQLGHEILEKSASKEGGGGPGRASAARSLGANFDYVGARYIRSGMCRVALSAEERQVGYIPLLHIALFVWYQEHSYSPSDATSGFLAAAKKLTFTVAGLFDPRRDMDDLISAKQLAASTRERYDPDLVSRAILRAVAKVQGADTRQARIAPGPLYAHGLRWDQYSDSVLDEDRRRGRFLEGDSREHEYTAVELDSLIDTLYDLASACAAIRSAAALTRSGHGVFRVEVAEDEAEAARVLRASVERPPPAFVEREADARASLPSATAQVSEFFPCRADSPGRPPPRVHGGTSSRSTTDGVCAE